MSSGIYRICGAGLLGDRTCLCTYKKEKESVVSDGISKNATRKHAIYCVRNATLAESRLYSGRKRTADGCMPLALTPFNISGYIVLPSHRCLAGSI